MTTLLKCDETHAMYNTMYHRSSKPDVYRASNKFINNYMLLS